MIPDEFSILDFSLSKCSQINYRNTIIGIFIFRILSVCIGNN